MGRGTAAEGGGGGVVPLGAEPHDGICDGVWIGEDVFGRNAQYPYILRFEPIVASFIARKQVAHVVADAVDLDAEL
jgi:hypothetical protein